MSAVTSVDDERAVTVMTGKERAAMLERLAQACATSAIAPIGSPRNSMSHSGRSLSMWRCQ